MVMLNINNEILDIKHTCELHPNYIMYYVIVKKNTKTKKQKFILSAKC